MDDPPDPEEALKRFWETLRKPENSSTIVAVATIVIAGAAIFGIFVGLLQWSAISGANQISQQQAMIMRQQLVGTQAAVLKFTTGFNLEGFFIGFTNIHDVAATGAQVTIHMTPVSLPMELPLGEPITGEVTFPIVDKDTPVSQMWPVPWPLQEFRGNDWPGKRAVRVEGAYTYGNGFGDKISESFCTVWLPRSNVVTKAENAFFGGPVNCEGLESIIRDVQARMREAAQEKNSPN